MLKILEQGRKAPGFSLENQNGKKIKLSSFQGKNKVILYFYPKAMTPGCTVQACGIRDSKARFSRKKAIVLAISPDSVERLKKFADRDNLNFDLLSDPEHKVAERYGVWGLKKFMGREYEGIHRITFVIGLDGKIETVMKQVKTKTHHQDVLELL